MRLKDIVLILCIFALGVGSQGCSTSKTGVPSAASLDEPVLVALAETQAEGEPAEQIADPLEPLNRVIFEINDKLYFIVLRPVATGYSFIVPEPARESINNFFKNLAYPVRLVSCLLQGKGEKAWLETQKFLVNSTGGVLGLINLAEISDDKFKTSGEDLGQTFGYWGAGHGFYLVLPVFGPSSLRDGLGRVGDYFLDPLNYLEPQEHRWALSATDVVNSESLRLGDYEDLREAAIDPYTAFKDVYVQYRKAQVEDSVEEEGVSPPTRYRNRQD